MSSLTAVRTEAAAREGSRSVPREAALSVIATGTTIVGELNSDGVVKVEGTVMGSVRADRQVLVAKGGRIEGDVYTREAVVGGEIRGSILADERVGVQASSIIEGDITTQRILVHEGGEVNGHVRMGNPQALTQASQRSAEASQPKKSEAEYSTPPS
jgi:cytoskeletal protein CcmA (bactofilin family)